MKKSLLAVAFVLAASMAMAHGPPSAFDSSSSRTAMTSSIGGTGTVASAKSVSGTTSTDRALVAGITKMGPSSIVAHGGGSGGITSGRIPDGDGITSGSQVHQSRPVSERMLN